LTVDAATALRQTATCRYHDERAPPVISNNQLVLPFPHRSAFMAADFLPAQSNVMALAWLGREAAWPDRRLLLYGPQGCGKTHLLHAWSNGRGALLVDATSLHGWSGLPTAPAIAVDEADHTTDEAALLHLLNAAAEANVPVLLAARTPAALWPIHLPDLASRLRATSSVGIDAPEDSLLRALLARLFAEHQVAVPPAVQDWLLARLPRHGAALRDAVEQLDRASLGTSRRISYELARVLLPELGAAAMRDDDISAASLPADSPRARNPL
jgi:chromosomal replication initiation ATPase DnaA